MAVSSEREAASLLPQSDPADKGPKKLIDAQVEFSEDVYDAVLVAACGGVVVKLPQFNLTSGATDADGKIKEESMKVHPIIVTLVCFVLFKIQISAILCIYLDMDLTNRFIEKTWEEFFDNPASQLLLTMKICMVMVLAISSFGRLLGSLRLLVFCANPTTWPHINRPSKETLHPWLKWTYDGFALAPLCVLAQMWKTGVVFLMISLSLSVILRADSVQDTVFNALVISFIPDLDLLFWQAVCAVFHVDTEFFKTFRLQLVTNPDGESQRWFVPGWLNRGKGGKARMVEDTFTMFCLTLIYGRQSFLTTFAVHTNILPAARDVCTLYRYSLGDSKMFGAAAKVVSWIIDCICFVNYDYQLQVVVEERGIAEHCIGEDAQYGRTEFSDMKRMFQYYPHEMALVCAAIFCCFMAPQIVFVLHSPLRDCIKAAGQVSIHDDNRERTDSNGEKESLEAKVKRLEAELGTIKKEMNGE